MTHSEAKNDANKSDVFVSRSLQEAALSLSREAALEVVTRIDWDIFADLSRDGESRNDYIRGTCLCDPRWKQLKDVGGCSQRVGTHPPAASGWCRAWQDYGCGGEESCDHAAVRLFGNERGFAAMQGSDSEAAAKFTVGRQARQLDGQPPNLGHAPAPALAAGKAGSCDSCTTVAAQASGGAQQVAMGGFATAEQRIDGDRRHFGVEIEATATTCGRSWRSQREHCRSSLTLVAALSREANAVVGTPVKQKVETPTEPGRGITKTASLAQSNRALRPRQRRSTMPLQRIHFALRKSSIEPQRR